MDIVRTARNAATFTLAISAVMACKVATNQPTTVTDARLSLSPNLPAGFPLAPGLTPCKPSPAGGKSTLCEWHNVNAHAVYLFYMTALPKAGYTILKGSYEVTSPHETGEIGFTKGTLEGGLSVINTDIRIQVIDKRAM